MLTRQGRARRLGGSKNLLSTPQRGKNQYPKKQTPEEVWRRGINSHLLALSLTSVRTTDPGCKRSTTPGESLPRQSRDKKEVSRRRPGCRAWGGSPPAARLATPGRPAGAPGPGRERAVGAILAWRRVATAVGGVGRRVKAALGDAWARSDAALAAGSLSPALPARVSGGALSELQCGRLPREWAGASGLSGRSWVLL